MTEDTLAYLPQDMAREILIRALEHLKDWPIPSAERFRNALIGNLSTIALNPMLGIEDTKAIFYLKDTIRKCVVEGRMIYFGFLPNELIKTESVRSRRMFELHELQHPYESWLAVSSWEGGMCGYYIAPHPLHPGETLVVEIYGIAFPDALDLILIYDIVSIEAKGVGCTLVHPLETIAPATQKELEGRGANSLDPLVTMLRILADASIPVVDKPAPVKLNKQRAKKGYWPIPAHTEVHTKDYVAQFMAVKAATRGPDRGGHHASPISHWRRAHHRTLATGRVVPVRSTKVNWRDTEELHRLFYHVPNPKEDNHERGHIKSDNDPKSGLEKGSGDTD